MNRLMILPSRDFTRIRVVTVPGDLERHEAFRHATSVIAQVEENKPGYTWEDLAEALEEHGFHPVDFLLGPALD